MNTSRHLAILTLSMSITAPAQADVFKCTVAGQKTTYQTTPCKNADAADKIDIKRRSAEQDAAAAASLKQWEARYAKEEAAKQAAQQELRARQLREAEVQAAQTLAIEQARQADAQYQQAEALEQQARAIENANRLRSLNPPVVVIRK